MTFITKKNEFSIFFSEMYGKFIVYKPLNLYSISFVSLPMNKRQSKNSQLTATVMSFTDKRKRRWPMIDPFGTPQFSLPGVESFFPTLKERYLLVRYDLNHEVVESENSRQVIFPEGYHDQWCRKLFVDQSESFLLIALFQNHSGFYY